MKTYSHGGDLVYFPNPFYKPTIAFKRLCAEAKLPTKAYKGDAGIDFYTIEAQTFYPEERRKINTGLAAIIPEGYALIFKDRSGWGNKGLHCLAGVIDQGYNGEIIITIQNLTNVSCSPNSWDDGSWDDATVNVPAGGKIAQALLLPVPDVTITEWLGELPTSERGNKGFGSSDKIEPKKEIKK